MVAAIQGTKSTSQIITQIHTQITLQQQHKETQDASQHKEINILHTKKIMPCQFHYFTSLQICQALATLL